MAKSDRKEATLKNILKEAGLLTEKVKGPKLESLDSNIQKDIKLVYKTLGGTYEKPPYSLITDINAFGGVVELDEENHFNRYRLKTLDSEFYKGKYWSPSRFDLSLYKQFCEKYESKCAAFGKFWTSPSTEKQFGSSDDKGMFLKNGSARWKQRAYYDFVKDAAFNSTGIPLARVSIYENIQGYTVGDILGKQMNSLYPKLIDHIQSKFN